MLCLLYHNLQATGKKYALVQASGSSVDQTCQNQSTAEEDTSQVNPAAATFCDPEWVACSAANLKSMLLPKQHVRLLLAMDKSKNGAPP